MSTEIKRIYLDTCTWCRPFDAPANQRIISESDAVAGIFRRADAGDFEIIGSSILLAETSMITSRIKQESVISLVRYVASYSAIPTDRTRSLAAELMQRCAIDAMDAMHVAVAIESNAKIFVTTDDIILNKAKCLSKPVRGVTCRKQ